METEDKRPLKEFPFQSLAKKSVKYFTAAPGRGISMKSLKR